MLKMYTSNGKTISLRRCYKKILLSLLGREGFLKQDAESKAVKKNIIIRHVFSSKDNKECVYSKLSLNIVSKFLGQQCNDILKNQFTIS